MEERFENVEVELMVVFLIIVVIFVISDFARRLIFPFVGLSYLNYCIICQLSTLLDYLLGMNV